VPIVSKSGNLNFLEPSGSAIGLYGDYFTFHSGVASSFKACVMWPCVNWASNRRCFSFWEQRSPRRRRNNYSWSLWPKRL